MTETDTMPIAEPIRFTYKCRVECAADFGKIYNKSIWEKQEITDIKGKIDPIMVQMMRDPSQGYKLGNSIYTFSSGLELDELLKWEKDYKHLPDCHVLFQTLELIENYTGERKYDR